MSRTRSSVRSLKVNVAGLSIFPWNFVVRRRPEPERRHMCERVNTLHAPRDKWKIMESVRKGKTRTEMKVWARTKATHLREKKKDRLPLLFRTLHSRKVSSAIPLQNIYYRVTITSQEPISHPPHPGRICRLFRTHYM